MEILAKADPLPPDAATQRPVGTWAVQAVLAAMGIYVAASSFSLGIWSPEGPRLGFFPLVLAIALVVLSALWCAQTPRVEPVQNADQRRVWRSAGVTVASLIVLGLVLDLIGFQVAMFIFLIVHLRFLGKVRWPVAIAIALAGSVGAFHLFSDFLLVPMPLATLWPLSLWGV